MTQHLPSRRNYFIIYLSLALCVFNSCKHKESQCKDFRAGTFVYGEKQWSGVIIHREQNSQIEILGDTLSAYFKIIWTGECTYDLVGEKVVYHSEINPLLIDTLHVTISEIINDSTYRYTSVGGEGGDNGGTIIRRSASAK
jgi:hypothetical protein